MKIILTDDFKNSTILAEKGIRCVLRGFALVNDKRHWLQKLYNSSSYDFKSITLEDLQEHTLLVTDEDKNDADILNNLFDITYEPCLELTTPEDMVCPLCQGTGEVDGHVCQRCDGNKTVKRQDEKGTVLGGEKFGTYKIRINSMRNNKSENGIQGTYQAIVLIGEKYTEDTVHVITTNKSYIGIILYFDGLDAHKSHAAAGITETEEGLTIGPDSAFTINFQFSLSQIHMVDDEEGPTLEPEYDAIMQQYSFQKDQTTTQLSMPGMFLVPSGKEYTKRVDLEDGRDKKHLNIAYMDKTFNLIPDTYKNNNIFNVTPRFNIFDEHNDKFVKPQTMISYGGLLKDKSFMNQTVAIEYDKKWFSMNEKAPTGASRFDLFGGATKKENSSYNDADFYNTTGYLRLVSDRGYHYSGNNLVEVLSNANSAGIYDGALYVSDNNKIGADATTGVKTLDFHAIDTEGITADGISGGMVIDSNRSFFGNLSGLTAIGTHKASAFNQDYVNHSTYKDSENDPYFCKACDGKGKMIKAWVITHVRFNIDDPVEYYTKNNKWLETSAYEPEVRKFDTKEHADVFVRTNFVDDGRVYAVEADMNGITCDICNGDGRVGAYTWPGRSMFYGLNTSAVDFCGYNNTFIGHKGLLSNYGHDAIIFGKHNSCGNREYDICLECQGNGRITCDTCSGSGKVMGHPLVECSSCLGFGYVTYSGTFCTLCNGTGTLEDGSICYMCYNNRYELPGLEGSSCSAFISGYDAIYDCPVCKGKTVILDLNRTEPIDCENCEGIGKAKCDSCDGEGYIEGYIHPLATSACPTCQNTLVACSWCNGQGYYGEYEKCLTCDGTGVFKGSKCAACDGHGFTNEICRFCEGDRQVCKTCEGYGDVTCDVCEGEDIIDCPECNSPSNVKCDICDGEGYVDEDICNEYVGEYNAKSYSDWAKTIETESDIDCPFCDGTGYEHVYCIGRYALSNNAQPYANTSVLEPFADVKYIIVGATFRQTPDGAVANIYPMTDGYEQKPIYVKIDDIGNVELRVSECQIFGDKMTTTVDSWLRPNTNIFNANGTFKNGSSPKVFNSVAEINEFFDTYSDRAFKIYTGIYDQTFRIDGVDEFDKYETANDFWWDRAESDNSSDTYLFIVSYDKCYPELNYIAAGPLYNGSYLSDTWSIYSTSNTNVFDPATFFTSFTKFKTEDEAKDALDVITRASLQNNIEPNYFVMKVDGTADTAHRLTPSCDHCHGEGKTHKFKYICPKCGNIAAYKNQATILMPTQPNGIPAPVPVNLKPWAPLNPVLFKNYYTASADQGYINPNINVLGRHECKLCDGLGYVGKEKRVEYLGQQFEDTYERFLHDSVLWNNYFTYGGISSVSYYGFPVTVNGLNRGIPQGLFIGTTPTSARIVNTDYVDVKFYPTIGLSSMCPCCSDMFNSFLTEYIFADSRGYATYKNRNVHDRIWPNHSSTVSSYLYETGADSLCTTCNFNNRLRDEKIKCRTCHGTGKTDDSGRICYECLGTGKVDNEKCSHCNGTGLNPNVACPTCNGTTTEIVNINLGSIKCPNCVGGKLLCEECNGVKHWYCTTCGGDGEVEFQPTIAYEDGKVVAVGDGYFYKNLMLDQDNFDMYRDYINIHPEDNCNLNVGQYIKKLNVFSVENHGMLMVHNNNYDEIPDPHVKHNLASDFFAVRGWAKYNDLQERFANLQNGCYAPDAIYFTKRTAHNEEWKLRIRELDYLLNDSYIKTNASMLKTAALNQAIYDFHRKNTTFLLRLGPIIYYSWKGRKGVKGGKGLKGLKGRKGTKGAKGMKGFKGMKGVGRIINQSYVAFKGQTLGVKGFGAGMKGLKGLKGTPGYENLELHITGIRTKFYIADILAAIKQEFGRSISNTGNLGKNSETYTFYCLNGDPVENLYFKGVRLRKMANGNYQTLNTVKGIKPAQVQRIVYKDNGYNGEYGVMNFNYAYNNRFLA